VKPIVAVVAFVLVYLLLVSERVERLLAVGIGAAVVLAFGVVGPTDVLFSRRTGIDWNVLVLLASMMVVVGGLRRAGILDEVAQWVVYRSRGSVAVLMVLLCSVSAAAAVFLSDVTVVVLMAPVTLVICSQLGLAPVPLLIGQTLAANIGGSGSLVGDPAVTIVASRAGLSFVDVMRNQLPVAALAFGVFLLVARWLLVPAVRDVASGTVIRTFDVGREVGMEADIPGVADRTMARRAVAVVLLVVVGFLTGGLTGLAPSIVALAGAALMWLVVRGGRGLLVEHVEWETLGFLAALFVVVGALVKVGVIARLADVASSAVGSSATIAVLGTLVVSAAVSALVDNVPYVATMAPVIATITAADPSLNPHQLLWYALAVGAVLGGNATAIGASANIVVVGVARRADHPIGFWTFTRYGVVVAALTVTVAAGVFALRLR
jgi:Na+/H+ antiporter NhaD/arsenite permease-like protein